MTTPATAIADPPQPPSSTGPLEIDPGRVQLDHSGMRTRDWFVILPEGMIADDLKVPEIWSRVQKHRQKALAQHDKLYLVAFDGDWAIEARVAQATRSSAVLALTKRVSLPQRTTPLFEDDEYRVEWTANGYQVVRKADAMPVGRIFPTEEFAIAHIRTRYPERLA